MEAVLGVTAPAIAALPPLGIGCSPLGNRRRVISDADAAAAIAAALAQGIAYFDVAPYYGFGLAERRLGDALRDAQGAAIVSTKVGRLLVRDPGIDVAAARSGFLSPLRFRAEYDYSFDGIMRSFEGSLERLERSHVDIVLVHDIGAFAHGDRHPERMRQFLNGGYRALDDLKRAGTIGAVGLGVNEIEVCHEVLDAAPLDCILLAGNYTLLDHRHAAVKFLDRCEAADVGVILAAPYNSGLLARGGRTAGPALFNFDAADRHILDRVARIERICRSFDVPLAAALQFCASHPAIRSVLPGAGSAERVKETHRFFHWEIPPALWSALRSDGLLAGHVSQPGRH